jgi:uncharacterized protein
MSREEINTIIINSLKGYDPRFVGLFGSFARHQSNKGSDLDILVRFGKSLSLLQLLHIENELTDKLGIKVDLVTEGSIRNIRIKESIRKDLQIIYQA